MLDYESTAGCRMEFLAARAGRPGGRTVRALRQLRRAVVSPTASRPKPPTSAGAALQRVGVRTGAAGACGPAGWTGWACPVKGKIPPARGRRQGRALARLTDLGWGGQLRELFAADAPDREVPAGMLNACVQVLAEWGWAQRPVAVVQRAVAQPAAAGRVAGPRLSRDWPVAVPRRARVPHGGPRSGPGGNSAFRLAAVWDQFQVPEGGAAWLAENRGPVLLVDDLADSRWTLTVAGRALRLAGAEAVLPFVLALKG